MARVGGRVRGEGGREGRGGRIPRGAPGPETHPKWPPQGVTTRMQLGLSLRACRGMALAGAMGSLAAYTMMYKTLSSRIHTFARHITQN